MTRDVDQEEALFDGASSDTITQRVAQYYRRLLLSGASYQLRNWARAFLAMLQEPETHPVLAEHLAETGIPTEAELLQLEYGRRTFAMWKRMARPLKDDIREEWLCFLEALAEDHEVELEGGAALVERLVRALLLD